MSPDVIVAHEATWRESHVQGDDPVTPAQPLPAGLVTKLVRARVAETDERWG